MENFWMYQVEKLEEEQAKQKEQKEQTEQRDGDEVWTACDDFSFLLLCWWLKFAAVTVSLVSGVLGCAERSGIAQCDDFMRTAI